MSISALIDIIIQKAVALRRLHDNMSQAPWVNRTSFNFFYPYIPHI